MKHTPEAGPVSTHPKASTTSISVAGIRIAWDLQSGSCTFEGLPVALMWTDTTLAGLMAGVRSMVGTERFALALQSEGRNSVETDWQVISQAPTFEEGFRAIANIAATAGWGVWEVAAIDRQECACTIRVYNSWEAHYQRALGVSWGCGMLAGKMAGYCTKLFGVNCWAEQTSFAAKGDACDAFVVSPSTKTIEQELSLLLQTDNATKADMAVALQKLQQEIEARTAIERQLKEHQQLLEQRVEARTRELAASEAKFRTIIESSPMGVHLYTLTDAGDLVFTASNPMANVILGVDNNQYIGKTIEDAFPAFIGTDIPELYKDICRHNRVWQSDHVP